ncbi:RluA family pseudouridine synthase [Ferruginibacter albus]|uniref:RluA family pseudouridine synthase n=1 Tax=Ferruginibacter albus TaxID=2875540 RepID=UPI001CC4B600|nr:RluA family pseudouridine synthase [Ferruginibacter albus]UAY51595.1 RluA family pseudouridine synthase [Ferruginibacter albus]
MTKLPVEIIFENDSFIAINKPAGLLSIPDREQSQPSLKDLLLQKFDKIYTVHRLDKDTSGIIVFAKDEITHKFLSAAFEQRQVEKFYLGLVHGAPQNNTGTIDEPIMEHPALNGKMIIDRKGKTSVTDYEVLENFGKFSLVKFQIHTGRTHQIRVHAKHIGHPIVCDPVYSDGNPVLLSSIKRKYKLSKNEEEEKPLLSRTALHSYQLKFKDKSNNFFDLAAELPKDLKALLQQLRKLS